MKYLPNQTYKIMKPFSLTLLIYFLLSFNLFSQLQAVSSYEPGQIIKKNNDTIHCRIELTQVYEGEIAPLGDVFVNYKTDDNKKVQSIKIKEIKAMKTALRTYQNIVVDKEELLFKDVVYGNVALLQYPRINIDPILTSSGIRGYKFGAPDIKYYAIKTNETVYIIKQKKDIKSLMQLFGNCPEAKAIAEDKKFKLEDLKSIVSKLNNCK
jgi:hypothetical protein